MLTRYADEVKNRLNGYLHAVIRTGAKTELSLPRMVGFGVSGVNGVVGVVTCDGEVAASSSSVR